MQDENFKSSINQTESVRKGKQLNFNNNYYFSSLDRGFLYNYYKVKRSREELLGQVKISQLG